MAKLTKQERMVKKLEGLLSRRESEIQNLNKQWKEEIARVERKNKMTRFQLELVKKGEWPL